MFSIEIFGLVFLYREIFVFVLYLGIIALTTFIPRFTNRWTQDKANQLAFLITVPITIGVMMSFLMDNFLSSIGVEVVGAYITGIAFVLIDRLYFDVLRQNNSLSPQEKMRKSTRKLQAVKKRKKR